MNKIFFSQVLKNMHCTKTATNDWHFQVQTKRLLLSFMKILFYNEWSLCKELDGNQSCHNKFQYGCNTTQTYTPLYFIIWMIGLTFVILLSYMIVDSDIFVFNYKTFFVYIIGCMT